jgi:hypothetical protein
MGKHFLDLWRDVVYAMRVLAKSRGFTAVGVLSLTLGIGVCSVFYSEMNALVFRPLPATRSPQALVALESLSPYPYFERYRQQAAVASAAAFVGPAPFSLVLDAWLPHPRLGALKFLTADFAHQTDWPCQPPGKVPG